MCIKLEKLKRVMKRTEKYYYYAIELKNNNQKRDGLVFGSIILHHKKLFICWKCKYFINL